MPIGFSANRVWLVSRFYICILLHYYKARAFSIRTINTMRLCLWPEDESSMDWGESSCGRVDQRASCLGVTWLKGESSKLETSSPAWTIFTDEDSETYGASILEHSYATHANARYNVGNGKAGDKGSVWRDVERTWLTEWSLRLRFDHCAHWMIA